MSAAGELHDAGMFQRFFRSEASGAIVLVFATILALVWANSPWSASYFDLQHTYIGVSWGDATFHLSLQHWINDGLMVLFFFVVGLEIKRELLVGHISSVRLATVPVVAAVGGMLVPAALFLAFNAGTEAARGWGVPMATDIAFALGILALLGSRVPTSLKVFLTAVAIADDIGAVLVIAIFYTANVNIVALGVAVALFLLLVAANRAHLRAPLVYVLLGLGVWVGVFASGVHATVAGILVAFAVPIRARIEPAEFFERMRRAGRDLEEVKEGEISRVSMILEPAQMEWLDDLQHTIGDMIPSGIALEHALHRIVSFLILPLFALFNAGVALSPEKLGLLGDPVTLGVILGLVLGKQIGVTLFTWLAVKSGRGSRPDGVTWPMIYGVSCLAGVGFTMSLFISELAFSATLVDEAKIGILAGSLIAGLWGYLVLRRAIAKLPTDAKTIVA
ncbi:MAG: Na+/H+ antiporter NhaA [Gemmatimonadales bacterium]